MSLIYDVSCISIDSRILMTSPSYLTVSWITDQMYTYQGGSFSFSDQGSGLAYNVMFANIRNVSLHENYFSSILYGPVIC